MGADVPDQVILLGTGVVTIIALEWLLPSVGADVPDQVILLGTGVVALFTLERLLPHVDAARICETK